ncbi:MAG: hypothetical protein HW377_2734 [Actinobacteria bacterium]|nr:hypothetical protein [Actinomycetota bacterium]
MTRMDRAYDVPYLGSSADYEVFSGGVNKGRPPASRSEGEERLLNVTGENNAC